MTFPALLRRLLQSHYDSVRAFAKALDIQPSHLSRALSIHGQPFDVRACLRLAELHPDVSLDTILRAADKGDIADALHVLYRGDPPQRLTRDQQDVVDALAQITNPDIRKSIVLLAQLAAQRTNGLPVRPRLVRRG